MRRALDTLYRLASGLAMLFLAAVAVQVLVQMGSRLFRVVVPGVDDFAGYSLAAASFLALAPALKAGAHVRVTLFITRFGPVAGRWLDAWAVAIGALAAGYFTWAALDFVLDSWQFNEISTGMVATPMWIPRLSMPIGLAILTIALLDELFGVVVQGRRLHD